MSKYGLLKKKDLMKDELTYVDNPVESDFPGHWLPLSILKKIMEIRAQNPAKLTKQTNLKLKLLVTEKYIKTSPDFVTTDKKITSVMAPASKDSEFETPTKVVTTSLMPRTEFFTPVTTNDFKTPVTLLSSAVTKNQFEIYASQLPSKLASLINDTKTIENPSITNPETTDVSGKTIIEQNRKLTTLVLTTTEGIINNKTIDAITTSSIIPETVPEIQSLNLTTESITNLSEKSTAEIKNVSTATLTELPTTELITESTTNEITKEITKELNKSTESKIVLTTDVTKTTNAETGNPFY